MTDSSALKKMYEKYKLHPGAVKLAREVEDFLAESFTEIELIREANQLKVLNAFHEAAFSESHFSPTTGYGYNDAGRERLEEVFATAMGAEAALLRWQISSGTAAISLALFGLLRPGDTLLAVAGRPYDTLAGVIDIDGKGYPGSLKEFGIAYKEVALDKDGRPDLDAIEEALTEDVKVVFVQKSRGYSSRPALLNRQIGEIVGRVKSLAGARAVEAAKAGKKARAVHVVVDNCYGEFVETDEPCDHGADLCCGSLIKNPGGGIAFTGGYVAGRKELVEMAASRLNAPGVNSEIGPSAGMTRDMALGLYLAPHAVSEALKGAVFTSEYFKRLGLTPNPSAPAPRGDIVQSFEMPDRDILIRFCQSIQKSSPIDAHVLSIPSEMPGYDCDVLMASGSFTQGSSIEMSCDAPVRKPYTAFFQGGLVFDNVKFAAMRAASDIMPEKLS